MRSRVFAAVVVAPALCACAGLSHRDAAPARFEGAFVVDRVNGRPLPAVTWTRSKADGPHEIETLPGTVLLVDSAGRWTALVTERDVRSLPDGRQVASDAKSTFFSGTYVVDGANVTLRNADLGTGDAGEFDGERLTVHTVGIGDLTGQTATYEAHRLR